MKIVIDMNLSPEWVTVFETAGYQAVHWSDVGDIKATDKTITVLLFISYLKSATPGTRHAYLVTDIPISN